MSCGRAADLQHFTFDADGTQYALHLMCPWRIVGPAGLFTGREDYWRPAAEDTAEDDLDRGTLGAVWRDVRNGEFRRLLPLVVERSVADALGGFVLSLSGGYRLEAFPDSSAAPHDPAEAWRLFRPHTSAKHFVVGSEGIHRAGEA